MSLVLGKNDINELSEITLTNTGLLKVDLAGTSHGTQDVDIVGNSVGLATETKQDTVITELQNILSDTTPINAQTFSIDNKMTSGDDDTLTEALQTVVYGRKDASPSGLRALKADDQGRLMVDIDRDSVGLATEATLADLNSKITIGEDDTLLEATQNLIYGRKDDAPTGLRAMKVNNNGALYSFDSTLNSKITSGEDDSLTTATQVLMYGRKDTSPTGLYALKVNSNGALHTSPPSFTYNTLDTLATLANGTATSTTIDMNTVTRLTFFGSSTNTSDPIIVEVSNDNATWYEASEYFVNTNPVGANVNYSVNISNTGARYWRIKQTDTTTTAFTLIVNGSKK